MSILDNPAGCNVFLDVGFPGFVPEKARSLFPGSILPCDIYFASVFENEKAIRPDKIMAKGEIYPEENQRDFPDEEDTIYINIGEEQAFLAYLNYHVHEVLKSQAVSKERITQLLYDNADAVVKKVFREQPNVTTAAEGKRIINDFACHITSGRVAVKALLNMFSKDYSIFSHCVQVAALGMTFCNFLGWTGSEISDFGFGALFHDLGKITIGDDILNKPGKLKRHEFEIIKQHPFSGYRQLKKTRAFSKDQLDAVLYHHEAMDGSGYPNGLSGNDIPLYARVAHIVDVFDALTSERVYKKALSQQDALAFMRNEMHASCDPALLNEFFRFIEGGAPSGDRDDEELKAGIGTFISMQCEALGKKIRAVLVGIEPRDYIILRLSDPVQFRKLKIDMSLTLRHLHGGQAFGFKGKILELISNPAPLVLVTYPREVEKLSIRCEPRQACLLPAVIETPEKATRCAMVNLSYSGCRICIRHHEQDESPLVPRDGPVVVCADLPGRDEPVRLRGRIKNEERSIKGNFVGIEFADLSQQAADQWKAFVGDILELTR